MENETIMQEYIHLQTQILRTREQSRRVMIQSALLAKTFDIRNWEIEQKIKSYEREKVLTNEEIKQKFDEYVDDKEKRYFIEEVRFFDTFLANRLLVADAENKSLEEAKK